MGSTWIVGFFIFGYFFLVIFIFTLSMSSIDRDLGDRQKTGVRIQTEGLEGRFPESSDKPLDSETAAPFTPSFSKRKMVLIGSGTSRTNEGGTQ